jgi:pilus assembly protein CpaE
MPTHKSVVLVTREPATVTAVATALRANGHFASENVCGDLQDLAGRLKTTPAGAALVDLNTDPEHTFSKLAALAREFRDTEFIILSDAMRSDLMLEAMHAGARHFMIKTAILTELPDVLKRLRRSGHTPHPGSLISVFSASGGSGATSVAINLAWEMQLAIKMPVILIDLDSWARTITHYLGLELEFGLAELLNRSGEIDSALITSVATPYAENLSVLVGSRSARMFDPAVIDPHRLRVVVEACQEAYRSVVVDVPRVYNTTTSELARHSNAILIVFQATVKDIHTLRDIIEALVEDGVPQNLIHPVLNRFHKRGQTIPLEDVQKAVGACPVTTLANDYVSASKAVNLGKPLAQITPNSEFRRDIQKFAARLLEPVLKGVA